MIGFKTAIALFALLITASFFALKGPARYLCLVIVGGLAVKTVIHYLRGRVE